MVKLPGLTMDNQVGADRVSVGDFTRNAICSPGIAFLEAETTTTTLLNLYGRLATLSLCM
jgi:hypothetical protein